MVTYSNIEDLAAEDKLPTVAELFEKAQTLYTMYDSPAAFHQAASSSNTNPGCGAKFTEGSVWMQPAVEKTSVTLATNLKRKAPQKKKKDNKEEEEEFTGDLVLAKSCCFIYDAMIS
jgi:hypothetical protein